MSRCNYDPDTKFRRFKLLEFPRSFVGLATSMKLDLEHNGIGPCFIRTMYEGSLMTFDEAREVSPWHRAFTISFVDNRTLGITFKPTNECISRAVQLQICNSNRFVCDLRLIKADGFRCCNNINHSEIGRYYISGQYEYCNVIHSPRNVDFGVIPMKSKAMRTIRIRNESKHTAIKLAYQKVPGFEVSPQQFLILPNSSRKITITLIPNNIKLASNLEFCLKNPHDDFKDLKKDLKNSVLPDTNFLHYFISVTVIVICNTVAKKPVVSLHSIWEKNPVNTYMGEKLTEYNQRKEIANQFLKYSKANCVKRTIKEKFVQKLECYPLVPKLLDPRKTGRDFCKEFRPKVTAPDLFDIILIPDIVAFGRVGIKTYAEAMLTIQNRTNFDIDIEFLQHNIICYSRKKYSSYSIKIEAKAQTSIDILSYGNTNGIHEGVFTYLIDKKFLREHSYQLEVDHPILSLSETQLKFGMLTSDSFITCVALKLYNNFNVPIPYRWSGLNSDIPFEILPMSGIVPKHGCSICDITFTLSAAKAKTHEFILITRSSIRKLTTVEATILNRKLAVKFLQTQLIFRDLPLNVEVNEVVRLENSSREIATYHVVEPLLPGICICPMNGIIRPKSIITFIVNVKICCCIEFNFDLCVKINNKEFVCVFLTGNVIEPKLNVVPKNIFMPRLPCGLVTYVPINFYNTGTAKSVVEILHADDENIFEICSQIGNEKDKISEFTLEPGKQKTVFLKVYDTFRREYEQYVPFRINGILGPPNGSSSSTEINYYIKEYERQYLSNLKVKVKSLTRDINYVRTTGVFTVPWIEFSMDQFEIIYDNTGNRNQITFTMKNISKYCLPVLINTSKLSPNFSLIILDGPFEAVVTESLMKFDLDCSEKVSFVLYFHPQGLGKFVSVALFYLDKAQSIAYSNLTFTGRREFPDMKASTSRIIFPPVHVETKLTRTLTLEYADFSEIERFSCSFKEEPNLNVKFISHQHIEVNEKPMTLITVKIRVHCSYPLTRNLNLVFNHECGPNCNVEVIFCFTRCPITLHINAVVSLEDNPYPYYPLESQTVAREYLDSCVDFMERWLFQQGFRRDLYPKIPYTCHAIAQSMANAAIKTKGVNVSILNYMRRIAGPLMKHIHRATDTSLDERFRPVKEIHDTYRSIIQLLRSRGANLPLLQAKHLLSYEEFLLFNEYEPPKYFGDASFTELLKSNEALYKRLTKQSWFDLFLQSYKVFVVDSCFFECVCVSSSPRNIIQVLIDWYNDQTSTACQRLFNKKDKPAKIIHNLTSDLQDGIAIISAIFNHCPFIKKKLLMIRDDDEDDPTSVIIHNTCIIIEAMNILKLYFPLNTKDFLMPNYLQMLFLTIHLYVILPMFRPKSVIHFDPPLLRSSTRILTIIPTTQESLIFNNIILSNKRNCFSVEKLPSPLENAKKILVSIKYEANFVATETALLLIYGYNKTRMFDTYITFELVGNIGALNPMRKCKLTASIYRPMKVDISIHSPFTTTATYRMVLLETEPTIPFELEEPPKCGFYAKRLKLIDEEITLIGKPPEPNAELIEHKVSFQMCCLNTQILSLWLWFRSELGEFFVRLTTQPRWDLPIETQQVKVFSWPMQPCSCGEACECYRSTILRIPHRNELMLRALRYALIEQASETMMNIYDSLIDSETGQIVIMMLLVEAGTNPLEVAHILRPENTYNIFSRQLMPRLEKVTLKQHTDAILTLPVTIPPNEDTEKFTITLTSLCNMDIRTYRIIFFGEDGGV